MSTGSGKAGRCALIGCGGNTAQMGDMFLHTLGGSKDSPNFDEFIQCEVWKCTRCGNMQLYGAEAPIKITRKHDG